MGETNVQSSNTDVMMKFSLPLQIQKAEKCHLRLLKKLFHSSLRNSIYSDKDVKQLRFDGLMSAAVFLNQSPVPESGVNRDRE